MRQLAHTTVVKVLMLILVLSFSIWGVGDIFRGNPLERTVARAGRLRITVQQLNREFENTITNARQKFGTDLTAPQAKQLGLLDAALDGMIERALVDQDLARLGIDVSPKTVIDYFAAQPQFRDKDGTFNKALFAQILERAHLSEAAFIEQARQDLARRQLLDLFADGGKPPQTILDDLYKAEGQKRILDVVTVKNADMTGIPAPGDKDLRDYYARHPQPFTAPEYRGLTIARLSSEDVAKDIAITDDQLRKEYQAKLPQLARPERRDIVQTVLQDEARAKQLSAAAKASGNLMEAAKAMGYEAVPLDQTEEKNLLPELAQPVFALKAGAVSDPIHSSLGWHVVQVKKITPPGTPKFEDIEAGLREKMRRDQAIETVTRMVNQLDDELAAGHALEDIADGMKLRLVKIPAVDASGKTLDGKEPAEFPDKDDVLKNAFAQNSGDTSPIIDDKKGNYVVVRTDQIVPSAVKPFDTVKDEVAAAWKADEQAKRAAAEADKIAAAMRGGKTAASFAGQDGAEVRKSKPLSLLGDTDPALPAALLPQIFKLRKGEVITAPAPGAQIVLRLAETVAADPSPNEDARVRIAGAFRTEVPDELLQEYLKYLRTLFPVEIDHDVLDTVRAQGG